MLKKRFICAAAALTVCLAGCGQNGLINDEKPGDQWLREDAFVDEGMAVNAPANPVLNAGSATLETPIQAGMLTAGEWSDNENWGFFSNLISGERLTFPKYGLDPTKRIEVLLTDSKGNPACSVKTELVNGSDEVIWTGVSDNKGRVYLMNKTNEKDLRVRADGADDTPVALDDDKTDDQKTQNTYCVSLEITLGKETVKSENTDIMFIIDSTGSMYDEMSFLQTEFTEITNRIGNDNTRYSVNFYRDEGDDYLTKCNGFSSDVKEVQKIINAESAAGGKGQIAAVAQALDQTMNADDWSEDSVKLAFLIFDAPPYAEAADSLAASVETAADKGIRLIPVVGSGSDSDVEHFGRAIAIETGGKYVFLTDDSGIGESHEEPIIGPHEVRPLVDIMTDIINEYRG